MQTLARATPFLPSTCERVHNRKHFINKLLNLEVFPEQRYLLGTMDRAKAVRQMTVLALWSHQDFGNIFLGPFERYKTVEL